MYTIDNIFEEYDNIVERKQLQDMLHIGKNTAYKLLNDGDIKSIRIGKIHKIPKINVIEYLNRQSFSA